MSSLVVIHGTGVRGSAYNALFHLVEEKLRMLRPDIVPVRCLWGRSSRPEKLPDVPLCLPRSSERSAAGLDADEVRLQFWAQLYNDPLAELRLLGARQDSGNWDTAELLDVFRRSKPTVALTRVLEQLSLQNTWAEVRGEITSSKECMDAVVRVSESTLDLRQALSRAIVASITAHALLTCGPDPDSEPIRDQMIAEMVTMFLPSGELEIQAGDRTLTEVRSAFRESLWYGVQWLSAGYLERKRLAEAATMTPIPGDIILYQSPQGDAIRSFIAATIHSAPKPCNVLAHSLGSIAAIDVLVQAQDLDVAQLITIGSPIGLFYEINALVSLPRHGMLPAHFPQWLNIFDPRDLISYLAKPVFQDDPRVVDRSHESGQPLVAAHSAYWASDAVWNLIDKVIPQV